MYAIKSNQDKPDMLCSRLQQIVPHMYGKFSQKECLSVMAVHKL